MDYKRIFFFLFVYIVTSTCVSAQTVVFSDDFERADNPSLGASWTEVGDIELASGKMFFNKIADGTMEAVANADFTPQTSGTLDFEFVFDWSRTGNEGAFYLYFQIGDSAQMLNNSIDTGVGVNLVWYDGVNRYLASENGGVRTNIRAIEGLRRIKAVVDLDNHTYDVYVDGILEVAGVAFENNVDVSRVRFVTSSVNSTNFSGRTIDEVSIATPGSSPVSGAANMTDTTAAPLGSSGLGRGAPVADYDNDGDLDIYLAMQTDANQLLRNDGGSFTDVTPSELADQFSQDASIWGDVDGDGDLDLYISRYGSSNFLYLNDGDGTFTEVTGQAVNNVDLGRGAGFADIDGDEDLDLYVVRQGTNNQLFQNDGGGNFTDITPSLLELTEGFGGQVVWADGNNDGYVDLYVARRSADNKFFLNDGAGNFSDSSASFPLTISETSDAASWGDFDGDHDLDLFVGIEDRENKLYRNDGGTFVDVTSTSGFGGGIFSPDTSAWVDYDCDGDLDLYVGVSDASDHLYRNNGDGTFTLIVDSIVNVMGATNSATWADFDNDGDEDVIVVRSGQADVFLENNANPASNTYLKVELLNSGGARTTAGTRFTLLAGSTEVATRHVDGGSSGNDSQSFMPTVFHALNPATSYTLRVYWPSGSREYALGTPDGSVKTVTKGVAEITPTPTPTSTFTATPTSTITPTFTFTPTNTPTSTPSPTSTPTLTPVPTDTPVVTQTPTSTSTVTALPTRTPTVTLTAIPTTSPSEGSELKMSLTLEDADGNPLAEVLVYVFGITSGLTDKFGTLAFEVPPDYNESSISLKVVKPGVVTQSFKLDSDSLVDGGLVVADVKKESSACEGEQQLRQLGSMSDLLETYFTFNIDNFDNFEKRLLEEDARRWLARVKSRRDLISNAYAMMQLHMSESFGKRAASCSGNEKCFKRQVAASKRRFLSAARRMKRVYQKTSRRMKKLGILSSRELGLSRKAVRLQSRNISGASRRFKVLKECLE